MRKPLPASAMLASDDPLYVPLSTAARVRFALEHALLPLAVLALVAGTLLWGPYVGMGITAIAWRLLTRFA